MSENCQIETLIKKALDQVPPYIWKIQPYETAEMARLAIMKGECWPEPLSLEQKAVYALAFNGAYWKHRNDELSLGLRIAAQDLASGSSELFPCLVGLTALLKEVEDEKG
jgi:hypothetical protein